LVGFSRSAVEDLQYSQVAALQVSGNPEKMVSCRPGNYVLYSAPHRPPWPAVMVANEMVPKALRKNRLAGYEVPIFLLQKSEL
jgi:hypothetical protein